MLALTRSTRPVPSPTTSRCTGPIGRRTFWTQVRQACIIRVNARPAHEPGRESSSCGNNPCPPSPRPSPPGGEWFDRWLDRLDNRDGQMVARKSARGLAHRTLRADRSVPRWPATDSHGQIPVALDYQSCWIADFQSSGLSAGRTRQIGDRSAGWETRDTADLEVCGTKKPCRARRRI
jgi:hypothetical protein